MTDAELIYNACLRAERQLETVVRQASERQADMNDLARGVLLAIQTLREEIGRGINDAYPG